MLNPHTKTPARPCKRRRVRAPNRPAGLRKYPRILASGRRAPGRKCPTQWRDHSEAVQSSAEIAARLTECSADQFGRVFGISGDEAYKAAQKSSDNLNAIIQSTSVLAVVTQSISREWVNFTRERMEQNFNRFESLLRCRTPQDLAAVQSEVLRDNLESFLQCTRQIAEASMQMADEATKRTAESVERPQAA